MSNIRYRQLKSCHRWHWSRCVRPLTSTSTKKSSKSWLSSSTFCLVTYLNSHAIVTVPAYFNDAQRQATRARWHLSLFLFMPVVSISCSNRRSSSSNSADDMAVFLTTRTPIFTETYHEGVGMAGLHFLSIGIGLFSASQINARFIDRIYVYLKGRNEGVGEPEFRLREFSLP